ncbi:hypothetical protein GDO81_025187 [Engystomops pustulosus]|uniref:Uncharacterized protein n=1 Tax=Engystomops pustulosus TaxID=76066 RepID=A0AAV6ZGG9_ENGPU|nr:hypothetical protein GDO81_025187 [Engystomops pustulosus]
MGRGRNPTQVRRAGGVMRKQEGRVQCHVTSLYIQGSLKTADPSTISSISSPYHSVPDAASILFVVLLMCLGEKLNFLGKY